MHTYNHIYKNDDAVKSFLEQINQTINDGIVIRIHSGAHSKNEMSALVKTIKEVVPNANIIGCSAKYIIYNGEIKEGKCLISVSTFDSANIFTGKISCKNKDGSFCSGKELGKKLLVKIPDNGKAGFMLIFFPYAYSKIDAVIKTINKSGRPIKMVGGTAILENEEGQTPDDLPYVIEGSKASTYDMVYCYVQGPKLTGFGDYACGIEGVGKKQPIQTEGTIIKTIGDVSAAKWYADMLGKKVLENHPAIAQSFPLVMETERELAYYVSYMTDEKTKKHYLQTYPELESENLVSIGFFNPQKIYEQVLAVIEKLSKLPAESIFIYECHARASLLSNCARWEVGNFRSTNASGALLSGEIITKDDQIFYANYTFVVSTISEDPDVFVPISIPDINSIQLLQEENVPTLNYLLMNSNKNLSKELRDKQSLLAEAIFFNHVTGIYNQLKFQQDATVISFNKAALFCLENEKMMRLFSGVSETFEYLSECYKKLKDQFLQKGLYVYSYQETSLIVAATNEINEDTFEIIVDNIHDFLNSLVCKDIQLSYTAVTYMGEDDLITGLEMALNYARNYRFDRVRFDELKHGLKKEHENIHMLEILREALLHKRVVPYYQEIHSNVPGKRRLFESLIRITDENGKVYYPDQFLPISKEYALYNSLSELMVESVMDYFKNKDYRVSINLNVADIYNHKLLKLIFEKMKTAPNPNNYVFEIVETEAVNDYEYIKGFADRIHEFGGKIAIDDFGSGYSNLLRLFSLDADYIKIDGDVIKAIDKNPICRDLIEFMQNWCEKNNMALICEYVEDKSKQDMMEELGVAYSQGYYFSKPCPWESFA